ncbi:hypothetical protein PHISCL_03788 [Aspergillus sclerotialis]|uniref:Zn(2)-C6 fungal-type domain-containing protein n=1 Tax=Aspergillus sclerotialis TaxID=2070753 RepID=A0A3A2ZLF2_9EURO|nr:hypothetical protein PHISCL_03788 [Aspergillus sclerotialis]
MSTPSRDCQKCRLRRIKCDRSLPTCFKCASRSLECPGYSREIKFVSETGRESQKKPAKPIQLHSSTAKGMNLTETVLKGSFQQLDNDTKALSLFHGLGYQIPMPTGYQEAASSSNHSYLITKPQLLHHFTNFIAAQLVWVDNLQNPWRQYICPLTSKSPCVFHAVLAIAAANLHVKLGSNSPHKSFSLNILREHHQRALDLVTRYLISARLDGEDANARIELQAFREALAATLLLWHLEMHFPSSSLWRLHLRTAQALVYHFRRSSTLLLGSGGCDDFLISEFYCATIWPRLTLNVEIDDMVLNLPATHGTDAFLGFVQLMHRIIFISRATRTGGENNTMNHWSSMDITELEAQANDIRQSVISNQNVKPLTTSSGPSSDIVHVIDAWYYAILLYGYRALKLLNGSDAALQKAQDCLFASLSSISSPLSFAQNQPWPVFIARTECVGDASRQLWVESRLLALINFVCPLDRPRMLEFLKEWWARPRSVSDQTACWMAFREERAKFGKEFVIW